MKTILPFFPAILAAALLPDRVVSAPLTSVQALVAAVNTGSPQSVIELAPGTFLVPSSLNLKPGMTLRGAGVGRTILAPAAGWVPGTAGLPEGGVTESAIKANAYLISLAFGTKGISISNLTLHGKAQLHGAFYGSDCDQLHLAHLRIEDFTWSSIRTFRMNNAKIHDIEFVDAGGRHNNITGGALYLTWTDQSEIWNNRFTRSASFPRQEFYGIKGRQANNTRIHHNTILSGSFSIEFPFENDKFVEIDRNRCNGVISIPKHAGGPVPAGGYTFHIHHNWFHRTYSLEWTRNGAEVDHNLFDFSPQDDGGNLISGFGNHVSPGPTRFHNNLIKNPGRGVYWVDGVFNNVSFYNNHVIAHTTKTPRLDGLFGFNAGNDFSTVTIRDNIIECVGQARPLVRNAASRTARIENNTLINISDSSSYPNPNTGRPRGLLQPLRFTCGVNDEFTVDGWNGRDTEAPSADRTPVADASTQGGQSAQLNFGSRPVLQVKEAAGADLDRRAHLRFDLAGFDAAAGAELVLTVTGIGNESVAQRNLELRAGPTDTWNESTLTWANQPAAGALIRAFQVNATHVGQTLLFDVSDFVRTQAASDRVASFVILQPNGGNALVSFGSRESSTPPRLQRAAAPPSPSGQTVNFQSTPPTPYGVNQDAGTATVLDSGTGLRLARNAWKRVPITYSVTRSTLLRFDLEGSDPGEITAVGLDNDSNHTTRLDGAFTTFRLAGSQTLPSDMLAAQPSFQPAQLRATHCIPVGQTLSGPIACLAFLVDDDADASGAMTFRNVRLSERAPSLPLDPLPVSSYGVQQDSGSSLVTDAGAGLRLSGNAWKRVPFVAEIASNSWLTFDLSSSDAGEILAIGLDSDSDHKTKVGGSFPIFQIGGSDAASADFVHVQPAYRVGDGWVTYSIPVGRSYVGSVQWLCFIVDDDADRSGSATFRNLALTRE